MRQDEWTPEAARRRRQPRTVRGREKNQATQTDLHHLSASIEFGVTARALRFYEEKGLLSPAHMTIGRVFSYRERARLKLILRGRRVGLSISEIREILDAYREGADIQNAKALAIFGRRMKALELEQLEAEAALTALRAASRRLLGRGDGLSP